MDLLKCYQIFDVPWDCTWEELRTAYRRQVQKHHPDRHQQHPDKQLFAKERMLELNIAFDTLAEYYKKNGYLPGAILKKLSIKPDHQLQAEAARPTIREKPSYAPPEIRPAKSKQSTNRISWRVVIAIAIAIAIASLGYFFLENAPRPGNPYSTSSSGEPRYEGKTIITGRLLSSSSQDRTPKESDNDQIHIETDINKQTVPSRGLAHSGMPGKIHDGPFFTYGDTPGKVFEVQGVPTQTIGDIWFYGKSEVHFNRGGIVSWYNSPTHPLKAN